MALETLRWEDDALVILDQTELPFRKTEKRLATAEEVREAIGALRVRGAPAIGVAAAYGLCLELRLWRGKSPAPSTAWEEARRGADSLASVRPTAVNLRWALDRMLRALEDAFTKDADLWASLEAEARRIHEEDRAMCAAIGRHGAALLQEGDTVLTHCNAGALATSGIGTALAPVYEAARQGRKISVISDETRPLLQGSRLTAFELREAGIPVTVICDAAAASMLAAGRADLVIVGADRIAANGDFANKVGTLGVAVLAKEYGVPFYCAAPSSTIDLTTPNGAEIPIEERAAEEVTRGFGRPTAPDGVAAFNPAFDVTPAKFVAGFITERGVLRPPFEDSLRRALRPATHAPPPLALPGK
ncbi:MAG: S-methyl-5-thioribose-1-phosphate isomerase [Verrucomicrobiae bacterium]|nr:S-methyl-5-thioribose-1-phosphate isomerase [Verrucomicrobiae bacterium]